jgi:heat shock protein HtpX
MTQRSSPSRLPEAFVDPASGQRISLLDWKAANVRYSVLLALFMFALFAGIAYLLALAIDPGAAVLFIGVALLIAGAQNLIAYWYSDKLALRATGAREATREEHRYLVNVTEAVSIGAGVPPPKIYVIDSPAPNAFATGRNPEHGAVAVTTGLMKLLDRQELEGVIAHEMAHIRNYDILFLSMLAATLGAILILRDVFMRSMVYGRGRRGGGGRGGGQAIVLLLLVVVLVLAPLLATLLKLAVSRRREYLADATAAYITRNPEGLARALEKLRSYKGEPLNVSEGVRHLFFINPLARFNARALFATHPPIEERIARLRRM